VAELALRPAAHGEARIGPGGTRRSHEGVEERTARADEPPDDANGDERERAIASDQWTMRTSESQTPRATMAEAVR
jgi:hypothetical protein